MALDSSWYLLTVSMPICVFICLILMVVQAKSFRWYAMTMRDDAIYKRKRELFCLYGAYISGSICAIQCFLNHISNFFPHFYCIYGMSICVILHEAAKTFLYGFFLERANSITLSTKTNILPTLITKYILPIYISLYFTLYAVLCPLTFRGLPVNPRTTDIPTACLFAKYTSWVFYLSVFVELFNSVFFVWLFAYPLYKILEPAHENLKIINIIKYNVIFSTICCISSVLFLFYRALAKDNHLLSHYLWLAGNIDLVINTVSTFLMVTANRLYISAVCCGSARFAGLQSKSSIRRPQKPTKDPNKFSKNPTFVSDSMLSQTTTTHLAPVSINITALSQVHEVKLSDIDQFDAEIDNGFTGKNVNVSIVLKGCTFWAMYYWALSDKVKNMLDVRINTTVMGSIALPDHYASKSFSYLRHMNKLFANLMRIDLDLAHKLRNSWGPLHVALGISAQNCELVLSCINETFLDYFGRDVYSATVEYAFSKIYRTSVSMMLNVYPYGFLNKILQLTDKEKIEITRSLTCCIQHGVGREILHCYLHDRSPSLYVFFKLLWQYQACTHGDKCRYRIIKELANTSLGITERNEIFCIGISSVLRKEFLRITQSKETYCKSDHATFIDKLYGEQLQVIQTKYWKTLCLFID
eukprot:998924_1